jgi:hypothetical protein
VKEVVPQFPVNYIAARAALCRCDQIDECQQWANKAAAIQSYARQSKDESLKEMAARIQARAVRRVGELLQQVPAVKGRPTTPISRSSAARDAGLSKIQKDTALATARIPEAEFERLVEGKKPPPPYKLRLVGRKYGMGRPKGGAIGSLRRQLEKAEDVANQKAAELEIALTKVRELREQLNAYLSRAA